MAWTRVSAHEINLRCEKYKKIFDSIVKQRIQQRKHRLVNRFLFPLTEINANKKVKLEEESIELSVAHEQGFDYHIYESLREICMLARGSDFITVDSEEATWINNLRK